MYQGEDGREKGARYTAGLTLLHTSQIGGKGETDSETSFRGRRNHPRGFPSKRWVFESGDSGVIHQTDPAIGGKSQWSNLTCQYGNSPRVRTKN
jgi:hypothetical protein